eukprot:jgi/Antlo1/660/701
MYLQWMVCMGMHVLCCLDTQGSSTPPDESALTVNLSNEYEVKSVDERGNMIEQKTYRVDMCFQWDREVYGRAVEMLGGQQSHVSAERVETILRAMAYQSTGTERADVQSSGSAVEVQWNRDKFAWAIEKLGGQQSKVDGEEVEAILHAMAYQSTGKVDILHVSEYKNTGTRLERKTYEIVCERNIFEKTCNIMMGKEQDKMNADDIVDILHVMDYLGIRKEWEWACYDKLARKTMEDHKRARQKSAIEEIRVSRKEEKSVGRRLLNIILLCMQNLRRLSVKRKTKEDNKDAAIGDIEEIGKELVADPNKTDNIFLYTQHLLRLYAEEHGMSLTVDEKRKTLDLRRSHSNKDRRENGTEDWMLRVEVSEEYRRQREVQRLVEVLMETKDIAVEVYVREYRPEDRGMLERISCKGKKTELRIKCERVKPEEIAEHMQSLKNNVVELDVSLSRNLRNEDWKTVGEMTKLEWLYISGCDVQAETITEHMQSLKNSLVVLNVSSNRNLNDEDWETVGKMTKLRWLYISGCNVQAGKISSHMQSLKNNLMVLNVSSNRNLSDEDWKTVGEMIKLEWLYIIDCNVKPGTIAEHMQSLKSNLVMLYVSWNTNLSDEDWKTVGKMTKLEWLNIRYCDIQAGTIAEHMQGLKNNLVVLDVSSNTNLSDEDWKTVGEMTKLEWLDVSDCNVKPGTIAKHMQSLKNNLVVLDVSENRNLSDEDWKTVGEMTNLKKLNISGCDVQEEQFSRYLGRLRCRIEE